MADILNTYPVFESNQVLTSTQLNSLVNYLDQQNRLTRTRLIGMGVVCGLELSHDPATDEITISKGTGITSEGYLISMGECVTVKYREYTLPPGTIYEPFVDPNTNVMDISLWELLTDDADDKAGVTPLDTPGDFLDNKVVLLFIESYDKDLKSCLGKSCDELGKERILTIRKLLISETDLETVWGRTIKGKLDAAFPLKFNLPVINMPRVLFNPALPHSRAYDAFSKNYADAILAIFDGLFKALTETYKIYKPLLDESYDEQNPFVEDPIKDLQTTLLNFINDSSSPGAPLGIQYVYDLFLDLIAAYNEFKNISFDLMSECTPDMTYFPKHLMLGEAIAPVLSLCENSEYRHYFVQPPVYNLQSDLLQRTIALHNRIILMLESFDLDRVNPGLEVVDGEGMDTRITPSNEKVTALSLRSIPWYYDPNLPSSYNKLGRLKDYWNYDVSRKCPLESDGLVLNYEDQSSDQSTAVDKLSTPLFYDIQDYPFLRIEGHINKSFEETVNAINALKEKFDLPFKTLALQLDTDVSTLELDYSCGFEDIQEEYTMLRASFCGFISDIMEVYNFVEDNQDLLFDDDGEGEDGDEVGDYLEKIKDLLNFFDEMCEAMAECVNDFDFEDFQSNYKDMLTYIIDFFLVEMELMDEIEISEDDEEEQIEVINGAVQRLFPILYKIIDLLFYNRFLRIYYSFKRREYYLRKETSVFSTFIEKHPGVDHQAGVPKGGTFIIVYNGGEDPSVIADFNLPYLCCGEDRCVPMCDEDGFVFEVLPFARPDYAITTVNHPVEIDVIRNDANILGGSYKINVTGSSENGADITQQGDTGPLVYTPPKDFMGYDNFDYQLIDNNTGDADTANVTVLVKEAGEEGECYSVSILQCWGDDAVRAALAGRGIETGADDDIYQILLNSLRETAGFTMDELGGGVLEDESRRRNLLNCLGIEIPGDATYDDLGQMILQYQAENCGGTTDSCYSIEILQCWGQEAVEEALAGRGIGFPTGADIYQLLLDSLRETAGFTQEELGGGVLEDESRRITLLNCLGIPISFNTTYDELGQLILQYQADNCGGGAAGPCYTIQILQCWGRKNVIRILNERNILPGNNPFQQLLDSLRSTGGFNDIEIDLMLELGVLDDLLRCMGFDVGENTPPDQMRDIIKAYQADNCGGADRGETRTPNVDLTVVGTRELVNILTSRGVEVSETSSREDLENAVTKSKGGNKFTKNEADKLTKKSLTKVLTKRGGSSSTSDTKAVLINKLLSL